jgi:hypothetical protein
MGFHSLPHLSSPPCLLLSSLLVHSFSLSLSLSLSLAFSLFLYTIVSGNMKLKFLSPVTKQPCNLLKITKSQDFCLTICIMKPLVRISVTVPCVYQNPALFLLGVWKTTFCSTCSIIWDQITAFREVGWSGSDISSTQDLIII